MNTEYEQTLTHVDSAGKANMVDVTQKPATERQSIAEANISISAAALEQIKTNSMAKGDVFCVARIAGIQAAKQCANLIPLCHPLALTKVDISFETVEELSLIRVLCTCKLSGNTGVEMEALTGASVAALTLFDMCKAVDPEMVIHGIKVLEKSGGKSGNWKRRK